MTEQPDPRRFDIILRRVYEADSDDGRLRILVERLWPRGVSKDKAAIDHWLRDIAPSADLRRWYDHRPERWPEFQKRYSAELDDNAEAVGALRSLCGDQPVCFVFAARDELRNSAVALKLYLEETTLKP